MYYQVIQYFKFLIRSTNQHGVHSPFVYNLITKCFYDKTKYSNYHKIKDFKKRLKRVTLKINVSDFGAGSHVMKQQERSISKIAKNAGTSLKRAKLLYRITYYFKPESILELGTSLGIGTQSMSLGHPDSKIATIEGCPNISGYTKTHFHNLWLDNINLITGNFNDEIEKLASDTYDLIFFDGNHQKEATLNYFETLLKTANNNSIFIFDDIYWSKDMTEAWKTIKQHPKVTVTIDTFFWGLVFFRKEQVKEDFTVRV